MQLKVKELLKQRGMKMTELAAIIGVDQSNLAKSLDGNPTLSRLEDIANAIGVPLRELLPDAPPANPAGVLSMGGKRYALVALPDEDTTPSKTLLNAPELSPEALQERIYKLAMQCSEDGRTRAIYGFLNGHFVVVFHDGVSKRFILLFWENDGAVSCADYSGSYFKEGDDSQGWKNIQLAELIVHDILMNCDL